MCQKEGYIDYLDTIMMPLEFKYLWNYIWI